MTPENFQITRSLKVFGYSTDGIAHFFVLPAKASVTVVARSVVSGCVQICHDEALYVTFDRNLTQRARAETNVPGVAL